MMEKAVMYGVMGFVTSAVFVGAWFIVLMVLALAARVLGGVDDDEDEE